MIKIQIILNGHEDRVSITDILTAVSSYEVEVVNKYADTGIEIYTLDLDDLGSTELEAFLNVVDNTNWLFEEDAYIWKVERSGKTFNLNNSFIRDTVATDGTLTKIPDGTALKTRFEIPGFEVNSFRDIDLWIAKDFNPTDLDLLAEIGITITGDGGYFTITNDTACRVSFSIPSGTTDLYIIDDVNAAITIEV